MLKIKLHGVEYILMANSINQSGAITTEEDYSNGECSFAHLNTNGDIVRFREIIGHRSDIKTIGDSKANPTVNVEQFMNGLLGNSWHRK